MSRLLLLWRFYDRVYQRLHRLQDLSLPEGTVLRLGLTRYRGRPLTLSDGSVIRRGDRIGIIHIHNEGVASLHAPDGTPHRGALIFLERFRASMRSLSGQMATGALADVRALTSTTVIFAAMARAGFDVLPLRPRWWGRALGTYQRWLMARHHPLGNRRFKLDRFVESRAVWISREALLRRYGPASSSSERGTRA
ncbi:MAG: hypothetical protein HYS14_09640 [Candidatus Rokubacteria bacterium]|nr:hypothetical protein [Candidatus Rokubacteria bacterium]